jgi:hypothetical protein
MSVTPQKTIPNGLSLTAGSLSRKFYQHRESTESYDGDCGANSINRPQRRQQPKPGNCHYWKNRQSPLLSALAMISHPGGTLTMRVLLAALSILSILLLDRPALAATASCQPSILSCGCTITSTGFYVMVSDLTATVVGADCIDVKAPNVKLWVGGHSITGLGGGVGIHILRSASGAFVEGLDIGSGSFASVGSFNVGIQDDANSAIIAHVNGSGNSSVGFLLNRVIGSAVSDFSADNNAYGVELFASTLNSIQRMTIDSNSIYGMWLISSSRNIVNFFYAQDNGVAGVYLGCQPSAGPTGGACRPSNNNRIYDGPQVGAASASQTYGVAIDAGNGGNVVAGTAGSGDSSADLEDNNAGCGSNLWFNNSGSTNTSCIH